MYSYPRLYRRFVYCGICWAKFGPNRSLAVPNPNGGRAAVAALKATSNAVKKAKKARSTTAMNEGDEDTNVKAGKGLTRNGKHQQYNLYETPPKSKKT